MLKGFKNLYFTWLKAHRVFLNYTKFKTDTLVACGFSVGAHPGFMRRDEAEDEICGSLGFDKDEANFHYPLDTFQCPLKMENRCVTTSKPSLWKPQSKMHHSSVKGSILSHPSTAIQTYPYNDQHQFLPMIKSKEWPVQKVYHLAQLHVSIIESLRPLYISPLQDLNNVVDDRGDSLLHVFQCLPRPAPQPSMSDGSPLPSMLLHSAHNTRQPTTKVVLVQQSNYEEALGILSNLQKILSNAIDPKFHAYVFMAGQTPEISRP
jgi:hypothetical protein